MRNKLHAISQLTGLNASNTMHIKSCKLAIPSKCPTKGVKIHKSIDQTFTSIMTFSGYQTVMNRDSLEIIYCGHLLPYIKGTTYQAVSRISGDIFFNRKYLAFQIKIFSETTFYGDEYVQS